MTIPNIRNRPIHLGVGATAEVEPEFTGAMEWYAGYAERHAGDGAEARLVNMHTFSEPWDMWEMHPHGSEVVLCIDGSITLHQEDATGKTTKVSLESGEYAINLPGIWHTADVEGETRVVFITAGMGTEHRPR